MMVFENIIKDEDSVKLIVEGSLNKKSNLLLTYLNQNCYNHYLSHPDYKKLLDENFIVYSDGIGIYFALKYLGYESANNFNASDFNFALFNLFAKTNKRLFLIGGDFSDNKIRNRAKTDCINIIGYSTGFFERSGFDKLVELVNDSEPNIVIIGMGVPRQELLAFELSKLITVDEIICVGNFLEFYFGTKPRVPKLLRNSGIEWFFRLISEPKRLWKRYLFGIPKFLINIYRLKKTM